MINHSSFNMPRLTDTRDLVAVTLPRRLCLQEPGCFESNFSACYNVIHELAVTAPKWLGNAKALAVVLKISQLQ